jgi:hypothetical protein
VDAEFGRVENLEYEREARLDIFMGLADGNAPG